MNVLKNILIGIICLVALFLIVALFVGKEYAVEREISIDRNKDEVFSYILLLKNQNNYSVWANRDPEMKKVFNGTDGTVGFISGWESTNKEVGKGEQEILKIVDGERIDYELRFIEPFESTDFAYMTTASIEDGKTQVKWGFNGKMDYPMNMMLLFMNMEEMLGKDLQDGLNKLKVVLESQQPKMSEQEINLPEEKTALN